jgi:hypothetical protein
LPRDDRVAPALVVRKPDEGFLDWGPQKMAFAGLVFAGAVLGAGLLITLREGRRMA